VEASAAQKLPVTTTCPQCGCVLPSSARGCSFCDSHFRAEPSSYEDERASRAPKKSTTSSHEENCVSTNNPSREEHDVAWRGELDQRLAAYRVRSGKPAREDSLRAGKSGRGVAGPLQRSAGGDGVVAQSQLPFADPEDERRSVAVAEPAPAGDDDFSFTIAIGRCTPPDYKRNGQMVIDVSVPPGSEPDEHVQVKEGHSKHYGLYPVASLEDRRIAALIDGACLLFAYGGFLALFSSLGGQFTLSKLSAAVYVASCAIVYLQYFALFTVFGSTTPGMMFRGLQVASFSGAPPSPRQLLLRSVGYVLSAAAFFTGFLWSWWDEDTLTWHDRISRTYLSSPAKRAHMHTPSVAQGH
jgi:uncharacterized RDD family membrane protein YckC